MVDEDAKPLEKDIFYRVSSPGKKVCMIDGNNHHQKGNVSIIRDRDPSFLSVGVFTDRKRKDARYPWLIRPAPLRENTITLIATI